MASKGPAQAAKSKRTQPRPKYDVIAEAHGSLIIGDFCSQIGRASDEPERILRLLSALSWVKNGTINECVSDERKQYITAFRMIAHFLKGYNGVGGDDVGNWIFRFADELLNFDNGADNKLFRSSKPGGADTTEEWRPRALVACGFEVYQDHIWNAKTKNELCRKIIKMCDETFSNEYPNLRALIHRNKDGKAHYTKSRDKTSHNLTLGNSVFSWWQKLKQNRCGNQDARSMWSRMRHVPPGGDPIGYARKLFKEADELAARLD